VDPPVRLRIFARIGLICVEPLFSPEEPRTPVERSVWPLLLVGSVAALIAVVSFGAGIVAERHLFGGRWLENGRFIGLSGEDGARSNAAFPRQAEVRSLIEDEYFFLPASPEAQATFRAELERGAMAGMAAVAATPMATLDEYQRELDYGAAQGMTDVLADDYTVFLEPLLGEPLREELAGEYEGIGVWIEQPNGEFTITAPIPGSPAEAADLRPGDVIVAADGTALTDLENDAAMSLIRGPAGTAVELTIRREGVAEPFKVTVTRQAIVIPAVVYERLEDGTVGHISVTIFGDNTTRELDAALAQAKDDGVEGIVLDLRGNGGGWVTSAQEMIGRFVSEDAGPALYQDLDVEDNGDLIAEPIIGGGETAFDIPMVVLIDGGTASAAEIVAGAIHDYDRGSLVGTHTFGKGLVQRVHDFQDGSSARITFARWLTPDQTPIPEDGLAPDVLVEVEPESSGDPQLERAVELVLENAASAESP
jgi:carboxyl-terminal processing protease